MQTVSIFPKKRNNIRIIVREASPLTRIDDFKELNSCKIERERYNGWVSNLVRRSISFGILAPRSHRRQLVGRPKDGPTKEGSAIRTNIAKTKLALNLKSKLSYQHSS